MAQKLYFGIDFGTTNTSVVKMLKDEYGERFDILGEGGKHPFASIIAVDKNNNFMFGNTVKNKREELSQTCEIISSFKTLLGTGKITIINGKEYEAYELVGEYLKCIKEYINEAYNLHIEKATFSFPVDFSPEAREELMRSAKYAKIGIDGMVSESTAAFLATMGETKGYTRVMVIDWGGGTLDVSILENRNKMVKELSVYGTKIGGDDIDKELAERVHSLINSKIEDKSKVCSFDDMSPEQKDKMFSMCEKAKIQISKDEEDYQLTIKNYGSYGMKTITITNSQFNNIVFPIIKSDVLTAIDKALVRANLSYGNIDAVIIAGGSSNLRPYAFAIEDLFGIDKIIRPEDFQYISARGAAIIPTIGGNFKLCDDIGILLSDNTVFHILKKNVDGVGSVSGNYVFSLVEDSEDAHFIITNGKGDYVYDKLNVPTKGFLKERLFVKAKINTSQIAIIEMYSDKVAYEYRKKKSQISMLTFYYDLSNVDI